MIEIKSGRYQMRPGVSRFKELTPSEKSRLILAAGMLMDELIRQYQAGKLGEKKPE